ncbi:hypothetical protein BJ742DRAFT_816197 [Cladochytrium replicatum]|nr:hypothetical protein BJ742DRAFT_816197 [Cladochytrium replicatum]
MSKLDLKTGFAIPAPMHGSTAISAAGSFLFIITLAPHKSMHHACVTTTAIHGKQVDQLFPATDEELDEVLLFIKTEAFEFEATERLCGCPQDPHSIIRLKNCSSVDPLMNDMKANAAVRTFFAEVRDAIEKSFPLVHSNLERVIVNGFSLVRIWTASSPKKKPILCDL